MTYAKKTLSEIKLIHGDYGNFIKGQKLPKDKEKKYKEPPYKDLTASNEIDGEPLDEKCWPGYEKKGMKTMFGKRYPNCVKKKKTRKEEYSDWRSELQEKKGPTLPGQGSGEKPIDLNKATKEKLNIFQKNTIKGAKGPDTMADVKLGNQSFNKKPKSKFSNLEKQVYGKIYNKAGTTKVTDYSMVPDKFKTEKNFGRMGGVPGSVNRRLSTKATKFNKPVVSVSNFASKNMRGFGRASMAKSGLISKVSKGAVNVLSKMGPKGRLAAAAITGLAIGSRPISDKLKEIGKKRRDAAIDKQVDKYVSNRKAPINKVDYMPDNMYTVKRDKDGKVSGTGDKIRVVPGTRTTPKPTQPDNTKKSRFSQHTRMKLGNYGSLSPMDEATMTPAQKRKDTMLKKKYEKSDDMMDSFKDQYGKKKGKEVFYAFIRKKSMEEENIQEILDKKDIPHVKKLVGKLRKGSKTHAKQADDLEKAMKENTAIESELLIQDWNKDDIKFTEIETVDIIKAKPLKESKAKLAIQTAKMTGKLFKAMGRKLKSGKVNPFTGNVFAKPGAVKFSRTFAPMDVGGGARVKSQRQLNTFIQGAKENVRTGKGIPAPVKTKFKDTKKGTEIFADKRGINTYPPSPTGEKLKKIRLSTPVKKVRSFDKQMDRYTMGTYKPLMGAAFGASAYQGITGKDPIQQIGDKIQEPARKKQIEKQNKALDDLYNKIEKEKKEKKVKKEEFSDWRNDLGEDWQSVNRKDKTDGMSKKAVKAYRRENPGSKLKTAVTKDPKKLKKGSKSAKRRLSFCRRMKGMKKKLTSAKTRRDPDSRINKALRRWNC